MATILEALENADYNLRRPVTAELGRVQLHNAVLLLTKGYGLYADIDDILRTCGTAEKAPYQAD